MVWQKYTSDAAAEGITRSFGSMCRQIRKKGYRKPAIHRKSYTNYNRMDGEYPGHKVQIDIKYVPMECIRFPCYGQQYYQITAIDEYSCRRVLKIVKEKSTYETGEFLRNLETKMGFPIRIIQVDNGSEFVNDENKTERREDSKGLRRVWGCRSGGQDPIHHGRTER